MFANQTIQVGPLSLCLVLPDLFSLLDTGDVISGPGSGPDGMD